MRDPSSASVYWQNVSIRESGSQSCRALFVPYTAPRTSTIPPVEVQYASCGPTFAGFAVLELCATALHPLANKTKTIAARITRMPSSSNQAEPVAKSTTRSRQTVADLALHDSGAGSLYKASVLHKSGLVIFLDSLNRPDHAKLVSCRCLSAHHRFTPLAFTPRPAFAKEPASWNIPANASLPKRPIAATMACRALICTVWRMARLSSTATAWART